ncbi:MULTISPECIES: MarR family winged helix-turn-helix transcriptional regulator [unclassified Nesterenkonia]|uniref:MarR family winged helix-turn-helix transcriptional regulator n=1 Tax=unclassified Nesterenkonia TaxID=2629769 RepID=UPI001F4D1A8B|nr:MULTISPECIES: MarR family winged helix-turn-helix transcriptional regulator [unclassified Nesterenkonia]MCH8560630.1 MarR family winged helix-turn-helix transcriptional regulator [Nesterenkonia sp. DZ6]MCH8570738.1 MarR family winged helix-turn-helix transcriptional regulator [Nesterenkonia sp. AY15]
MDVDLHLLDDSLIRLRRLWGASRNRLVADGSASVEMSSLLVVEACARGADEHREVTVGDVADLADVTASTASRLVDRAEEAGLLHRTPSGVNARRTALVLTPAGSALRQRAVTTRTAWLADQVREWDPDDVERLGVLLARFADGLNHSSAQDLV